MQNKQYTTDCRFNLHFFVILSTIALVKTLINTERTVLSNLTDHSDTIL